MICNKNYFLNDFEHKLKIIFNKFKKVIIGLYNLINWIGITDNKKFFPIFNDCN